MTAQTAYSESEGEAEPRQLQQLTWYQNGKLNTDSSNRILGIRKGSCTKTAPTGYLESEREVEPRQLKQPTWNQKGKLNQDSSNNLLGIR